MYVTLSNVSTRSIYLKYLSFTREFTRTFLIGYNRCCGVLERMKRNEHKEKENLEDERRTKKKQKNVGDEPKRKKKKKEIFFFCTSNRCLRSLSLSLVFLFSYFFFFLIFSSLKMSSSTLDSG